MDHRLSNPDEVFFITIGDIYLSLLCYIYIYVYMYMCICMYLFCCY